MWARIKTSLPLNFLLLLMAGAVTIGAVRMAYQAAGLWTELDNTEARVEALRQKKAELEARLAELETPEAIERRAKANLNLKKSGESVVVVVPEKTDGPRPSPPTLWQKTKWFFAGIFLKDSGLGRRFGPK